MVQGSWWQKESCCSHSYSMRKTRGQPMHRRKEETEERAVVERSDPEKGIFFLPSPRLFLQVWAGRRKCVSQAALYSECYRTHRQGETGWREGVWDRAKDSETESKSEAKRENGRSVIQNRGGRREGDICSAVLCRSSLIQLQET